MKRIISFLLLLLLVLSIVGCDKQLENSVQNNWGVTLEAKDVTPTGLTIVCSQSGGEDVYELSSGSYYKIQRLKGKKWVDAKLETEGELAWTAEGWIINKESTLNWDVNWESLYGELSAGKYRIAKEIMNFKAAGDFEKEMVYANFEIK